MSAQQLVAAYRRSSTSGRRTVSLDVLRGLAIVLMLGDHAAVLFGGFEEYRLTLGRVAMPLFFLLAGHLARRVSYRTVWAGLLGVVLPIFVPWIDSPNVLLWYAIGAVVLVAARHWRVPVWVLLLPGLTFYANGWETVGGGYDPFALLGFMALGALVPRDSLAAVATTLRLPRPLAFIGQAPLTWYVGHLALFQVLRLGGVW